MSMGDASSTFNVLTMTRFGRMLVNKNDVYIGRSLIEYGEYSWEEIAVLGQLDLANTNVIEAGSNIGSHTVPLSQRVTGTGRLYAFEPQRLVFQTLSANLALNQCQNVHAFWAGLGSVNGKVSMPDLPPHQVWNFGGVSANAKSGDNPMIHVPCMTIDGLGLDKCALIKADVEGMELDVIKGGKKTIARCRPTLYVEADRREKFPGLVRQLKAMKYELWWHLPNLFNPDNVFRNDKDIFNVHSLNILGFPEEKKIPVSGLKPIRDENDWFC